MIKSITMENFHAFNKKVSLSLVADLRTKYLLSNSVFLDNKHVLKTSGIFGSNNTGKTSFIFGVGVIKEALTKGKIDHCSSNLFSSDRISSFSIEFDNCDGNGWLRYDFSFDTEKKEFVSEKLTSLVSYKTGEREKVLFLRDIRENIFSCCLPGVEANFKLISPITSLLFGMVLENPEMEKWKKALVDAGNSIEILLMYNIPITKTINILKGNDEKKKELILDFVKNADLSVDDFCYSPDSANIHFEKEDAEINEQALAVQAELMDMARLTTTYGGKKVPSLLFDSSGTKKIEAISSYIMEAFQSGKTLFVDELDNGLHFKLTRSIVSLFNNLANQKGQLIFTTHDVALLDTKELMRKEQIWFAQKDKEGVTMKSLSSFTAKDGVREASDLIQAYNRGNFGSVPDPKFINTVIKLLKD